MLPEIGASELLVIAVVALIVVGPKDLPLLLRKLGQFMSRIRGMAAEFRASFDEMARQSELDELRKQVEAMRQGQLADIATRASGATDTFGSIDRELMDVEADLRAPPYVYGAADSFSEAASPPKVRKPRARKAAATSKPAAKPRARKAPTP